MFRTYDSWKTRSPDDDVTGPEEPSQEQQWVDYEDVMQQRDDSAKCICPHCDGKLQFKALVDSEDRIWQKRQYCPECESKDDAAYWASKSLTARIP